MAPVGALHELPPLAPVAQIDRPRWRREHQRAGIDHVRQGAGIVLWVGRHLGKGLVARGLDEGLELPVRHRCGVDPEAVHRHPMDRRFFRIMIVGAHAERAAGNPHHVGSPAIFRWLIFRLGVGRQQRHGAHSMLCTRRAIASCGYGRSAPLPLSVSSKPNSSAGISPVNSKLTAKSKRNFDRGDMQVRPGRTIKLKQSWKRCRR